MKTQDLLLIGAVAIGGYFLFTRNASAYSFMDRETTPVYPIQSVNTQGRSETEFFSSTSEGVEAMNKITSKGGQLKRTSETLKVLGKNDTVARLGDGSIKRITVSSAKTDASGKTNFDRIIAKNVASKSPSQLKRKTSVRA